MVRGCRTSLREELHPPSPTTHDQAYGLRRTVSRLAPRARDGHRFAARAAEDGAGGGAGGRVGRCGMTSAAGAPAA